MPSSTTHFLSPTSSSQFHSFFRSMEEVYSNHDRNASILPYPPLLEELNCGPTSLSGSVESNIIKYWNKHFHLESTIAEIEGASSCPFGVPSCCVTHIQNDNMLFLLEFYNAASLQSHSRKSSSFYLNWAIAACRYITHDDLAVSFLHNKETTLIDIMKLEPIPTDWPIIFWQTIAMAETYQFTNFEKEQAINKVVSQFYRHNVLWKIWHAGALSQPDFEEKTIFESLLAEDIYDAKSNKRSARRWTKFARDSLGCSVLLLKELLGFIWRGISNFTPYKLLYLVGFLLLFCIAYRFNMAWFIFFLAKFMATTLLEILYHTTCRIFNWSHTLQRVDSFHGTPPNFKPYMVYRAPDFTYTKFHDLVQILEHHTIIQDREDLSITAWEIINQSNQLNYTLSDWKINISGLITNIGTQILQAKETVVDVATCEDEMDHRLLTRPPIPLLPSYIACNKLVAQVWPSLHPTAKRAQCFHRLLQNIARTSREQIRIAYSPCYSSIVFSNLHSTGLPHPCLLNVDQVLQLIDKFITRIEATRNRHIKRMPNPIARWTVFWFTANQVEHDIGLLKAIKSRLKAHQREIEKLKSALRKVYAGVGLLYPSNNPYLSQINRMDNWFSQIPKKVFTKLTNVQFLCPLEEMESAQRDFLKNKLQPSQVDCLLTDLNVRLELIEILIHSIGSSQESEFFVLGP